MKIQQIRCFVPAETSVKTAVFSTQDDATNIAIRKGTTPDPRVSRWLRVLADHWDGKGKLEVTFDDHGAIADMKCARTRGEP